MWYINGKKYDFENFKHPGGPVALELAKDRDATQLFKSYHPFTNPELVLKKYEVKEEKDSSSVTSGSTEEQLFDWSSESEFWTDLKSQVQPILKKTGEKANLVRWLQIFALTLPVILSFMPFVRGAWWSLFFFPLAVWVLGVNVYHDASHFALSRNWRVNFYSCYLFPWFSSPFTWYHQHVIGHHVYTNIKNKDPDMHHGTPLWRIHPGQRFLNHYKYQLYYFWFIWSQMTYSLAFLIDITFMIRGSYHKVVKMVKISERRKKIHYAGRIVTFCIVYVWPFLLPHFSWTKAIIWSFVPYSIFGSCFAFSSQFNHLVEETMNKFSKDWYKHQVMTSHTFAPNSLIWFFFTGGLNMQIEHHLFPGVNHWHLRKIQPIVERTCKKHNVPYPKSETFMEAFQKHIAHLEKMSHKPQIQQQQH